MKPETISIWKLFSFLKNHTRLIASIILVSVLVALLEGVVVGLMFPLIQAGVKFDADNNYPKYLWIFFHSASIAQRLQIIAVFLLIAAVMKNIFVYSGSLLSSRLQIAVVQHFRVRCIQQLMRVGMNYFNYRKSSDFQIIIDGYTESVTGSIVALTSSALPQFFITMMLSVVLFWVSWKFTLVAFFLVTCASFLVHRLSRSILLASKISYDGRLVFNRGLLDIINGMKLIRLFSRQEYAEGIFKKNVEVFNKAKYRADQILLCVAPSFEAIGIGMLALIIFLGAWVTAGEPGWVTVLFMFVVVLSRLITPIKILNHTRATIIEKIPVLKEITGLLDDQGKDYVVNGTVPFFQLRDSIEFKNVHFSYAPHLPVVIKNLSFKIPQGKKTAIVGPSGSGKSTLIELLLRFYDPQQGAIHVDGNDLRTLDTHDWRKAMGVVSQDVFLFNDTVRNNIAFAKPNAAESEIKGAAMKAHAHEFISELPNGYDTVIGERGVLVSGGQRQRLAIARAILIEPQIMVFDEATAALDSQSEHYVQEAIGQLGKGKTLIVIAHRLSTVFDADNIIVMDNGQMVESGTHQQLLAQGGLYAKLVKMQELAQEIENKVIC